MPDIDPPNSHQEEKCVGCHYADEHCVFEPKIKDQAATELSQEDLVQVVTSPYLKSQLEGLAVGWKGVANDPTFRAGVASVINDYNFRRKLQNFQVSLFATINTLNQINVAPVGIVDIRTLPSVPLHNSLAAEPEREGDDWPPTSMQAQLERAARSNRIANQPFRPLDPEPNPSLQVVRRSGRGREVGVVSCHQPVRLAVAGAAVVCLELPRLGLVVVSLAVVAVSFLEVAAETSLQVAAKVE